MIDRILGPQRAATVIHALADDLTHQDAITPDRALRLVCERAAVGDPLLLAAPGQVWQRAAGVDPDDVPAERLAITGRLACPPRVLVRALDGDDQEEDELLIEALESYDLITWDLADTLLTGTGGDL